MSIIKYIKSVFAWRVIKVLRGTWNYRGYETYSVYEIKMNEVTGKYKLTLIGDRPKEHSTYPNAVEELNKQINAIERHEAAKATLKGSDVKIIRA